MTARLLLLLAAVAACAQPVAPPPDGIMAVEVTGPTRIKVGEGHLFQAKGRRPDGTLTDVSAVWSITPAQAGVIGADGTMIPSATGPLTVRARAGTIAGTHAVTSYDWSSTDDGVVITLQLPSHEPVINRHDASGFPDLLVACVGGTFVVAVVASHVTLAHGTVSYHIGDGDAVTEEWFAAPDAGGLLYHGTTNDAHKTLAAAIAAGGRLRFTFTEVNGTAHEAEFRVTGLGTRMQPLLQRCPVGW